MNKKIKIVLIILGIVLLLVGVIVGIVIGLNKGNYSAETNIINKNSNIISQEKQENIISKEEAQKILENKYEITDISKIENLLKSKGTYEYLKIKNIKEDNDKYLVEADYYVLTSITEKEYSEMTKNKKIILNNKEYVFDNSNKVYSTEYGTVYIKGKPIESGYWIEKINGEYIFINEIGGVYNTINEIKENHLFYLEKNTKVSEIASDIENVNLDKYLSKNKDLVEYFTTVIYNEDNNQISVLVDKR